jgi:hypothetical protein
MHRRRQLPAFQIRKGRASRAVIPALDFDEPTKSAGLSDGFHRIQLGQQRLVCVVKLAANLQPHAGFIKHHRREPATGDEHRIAKDRAVDTAINRVRESFLVERKTSLQRTERKYADHSLTLLALLTPLMAVMEKLSELLAQAFVALFPMPDHHGMLEKSLLRLLRQVVPQMDRREAKYWGEPVLVCGSFRRHGATTLCGEISMGAFSTCGATRPERSCACFVGGLTGRRPG